LLATGCSAQWIKVALADLPVLIQMALNIGTLVTTLQANRQLTPTETAAIQNISAEAGRDLNLLQTLYNEYQANPSADTIQKIQAAIAETNQNLPAILQAAHIVDPVLSTRITAAVNLILTTVNSFAALIPQTTMPMLAKRSAQRKTLIPHAEDLKRSWNQQVCGATGRPALDAAFAGCAVK
jgi:hypothetical protein